MSAADGLHLNLPRAPDNTFHTAQPQGDSGRRDAKQAPSQQLPSTVQAGGGGAAPGSPPTFAIDPAYPLAPPPPHPQAGYRETEAQGLGALLLSVTGGTEERHNVSCGSQTLLPSSCPSIWVPELTEGSQLPDGRWKSHQTRLGMVPMPNTQPSWLTKVISRGKSSAAHGTSRQEPRAACEDDRDRCGLRTQHMTGWGSG